MKNTVVFDMDGVLFDTERLCQDSWLAVAEENGLPGMKEIFPQCIGLNANDSRRIVMNAYGEDFDYEGFREQASVWFWDYIEKNGLPMKPGVRELLDWLKENGWTVGLASSTRRSSVLNHLEQAGIRYIVIPAKSLADYESALRTLGKLLGKSETAEAEIQKNRRAFARFHKSENPIFQKNYI